ncbi:SDR family NAD(P)-dependent oxidoreductase [Sphingopyxis sp. GW247-27LB]|uniref:SDR family NAD(P)-dependent oxidoreductase n=1 Tax=Sphingopyxis sp. GW247-27LB TaxID=2012632 RepID=UPI000BA7BEA8|nr:SDR family NAD(P)-dependent oxidoreductase [Sphingopyxis sp. GW247-27LB]PAL24193.1 3-oxoacyl-ACP reductase [Sphingopyxis sp. GW247-27LB]
MNIDPALRSVRGMVALVTGAANGMGAATARLFASEGASVAVIDRDTQGIDQVVAAIRNDGGSADGWTLDVGDGSAIREVVTAVAGRYGGIDIVINNAGIAGFMAIDDEGYDAFWDRMLAVNLSAQQRIVRAALPWLRQSRAPRVVNIASTEALGATPLDSAYVATKAGVAGLTRALAVDLGKDGILVNAICPGPIDTPMTAFATEQDKKIFANRRTALRRYGRPEEVAQMTLSLCLPGASYTTGAVIPVDGGLMARNA